MEIFGIVIGVLSIVALYFIVKDLIETRIQKAMLEHLERYHNNKEN